MNLFSRFFTRRTDQDIINEAVANDATKQKTSSPKSVFKRIRNPGLEYGGSVSKRGIEYKRPEYDLNSIATLIDIDSYLRRAVEKYVELILKNGFEFVGKNTSTVKYVRKRFEQIAEVTSIPTLQLFEDICQQLIAYSNVFISKVRNEKASGGRRRTTFYGKELKPVAGYFVEDTTSMEIAKTENGEILGYRQSIYGSSNSPEWWPEDMIHMYYSRKRGLSFGTPLCYPVIDDIKALRKIEQNIEILMHQHTIPIIQYKIGTPERPGSPEEVSSVKSELEDGPIYGCTVTTERHEIKDVGVKINADGADKLAELFKMRVYAGLGVSPLVMGDGGGTGRQTAESLDKQMENTGEKFMKVIKTFTDDFMIKELLLEGGYKYDAYDSTDKVEIQFNPINLEAKHKSEEHLNNMYQGNVLTESEVRIAMGRDPMTEEQRLDTNLHHVSIPLALIKSVDETYTGPGRGTPSKPGGTSGSSMQKAVKQAVSPVTQVKRMQSKIANAAQPSNQHGKSLARPRIAKDKLFEHYYATLEDLLMSIEDDTYSNKGINSIFNISKKLIKDNLQDYMRLNYSEGYKIVKNIDLVNFNENFRDSIKQEELIIDSYFNHIFDKINKLIVEDNSKIKKISLMQSIFDNNLNKFENIIDETLSKSYSIGIIQGGIDNKMESIDIISDNCSCGHTSKSLSLNLLKDSDIPIFPKECTCYFNVGDNING